ncbi:MAG TPA: ABC transporter permease [Sphingomonas sp.]|nr:ABC transporter permease [Sphingomonas sp.]
MSPSRKAIRQTLTIARRDFIATVFTPMFLFFLLAPLIMASFSLIGGLGASSVAEGAADRERLVVVADAADAALVEHADTRLRKLFSPGSAPPELTIAAPQADPVAQARAALDARDHDVDAALAGPIGAPHIFYRAGSPRSADYLAALAEAVVRARASGTTPVSTPIEVEVKRRGASVTGQHAAGFMAVFGIFFLTLLLAGQAVGTMAEERSNKVIEVLAAAVPLESVFFGKLVGMFGSAVLFILFWGTIAAQIGHVLPPEAEQAMRELQPAIGWPGFIALFCCYFTMAYLLLGSVFLTIGAQASTIREIQMLSLPITFTQIGMFALASAGAAHPGGWVAIIAEVFPLSSPYAMAARAANTGGLWPHVAALVWQALWVSIMISLGARWFRRGVLKSGAPRRKSRVRDAAATTAEAVSHL